MVSACDMIEASEENRHRKLERCLRSYGQLYRIGDSSVDEVYVPAREKLGLNVIRSICDSIHAETVQNRPRPMFVTGGDDIKGRWSLQRKAKKLEDAIDGIFDALGVYHVTSEMVLDSLIMDGGVCKVWDDPETDEVRIERCLPFEIKVDPNEGLYGSTRTLYQRKQMDREVVRALFPDVDDNVIDNAARRPSTGWYVLPDESDLIEVTEGWRLGSPGSPGVHMISTSAGELLYEDWEDDDFPFVFLPWGKMPLGFWSDGIANQLAGIQYEINMLLKGIQEAHHLLGKAYVAWPDASGAVKPQWENRIGWILRVRDARHGMPQVVTPRAVSPEIYQHLDRLYQYAYEIVGASQLAAQAKLPSGMAGNAKAQMVYEDATSRRFLVPQRAYEDVHIRIADKIIKALKRISARNPDFELKYKSSGHGSRFLASIPWKSVDMEGDTFRLGVYPTSILPKLPSGRIATIENWINAGWLSREEGMRLLDFPDLDNYTNVSLASWDVIGKDLDLIMDMDPDDESTHTYSPPEPFYDLQLTLRIAQGAQLVAKRDDAPTLVMDQLRRYIEDTKELIRRAQEAAQPQQQPGMMPPPEGMPPEGMPPEGGPPMPLPDMM
jgi:hypothetical protein